MPRASDVCALPQVHAEAGEFAARLQRVRGPVLAVGVGVGRGDLSENLEDDLVGEEVEEVLGFRLHCGLHGDGGSEFFSLGLVLASDEVQNLEDDAVREEVKGV